MLASRRNLALVCALLGALIVPGIAAADVVYLKNGKKFEGSAEEKGESLILRLERGSLTFAMSDVDRVEKCPAPWEVYEEKAKALKPGDVDGHLELARWCLNAGLSQRMKRELELVLAADPDNTTARNMLGYKKVDGKWQSADGQPAPQPAGPVAAPAPAPGPGPAPTPAPKPAAGPRVVPDGSYSGASRGYVDDVSVQVTVANGKITDVRIAANRENRALTSLRDVPPKIVQKQSTQVDATSGATISSRAIMRAAETALDSSAPLKLADVPDGSYSGTSKSLWTDLTVQVAVKAGKIESVKVTASREPPKNQAAQDALTSVPQRIVDQQKTAVAPVAGGEVTSTAIMRAAQAALESAVPRVLQPK